MRQFITRVPFLRLLRNRQGAAMAEYALLAALIAAVAVTAVTTLGTTVRAKFTAVTTAL